LLKKISILVVWVMSLTVYGQLNDEQQRIAVIEKKLTQLASTTPALEKVVDFNLSSTELPTFVRAIGKESGVNIGVNPDLKSIKLSHNFSNAKVKDILVYLCKEHQLTIDITGNIISLKKKKEVKEPKKPVPPRNIPVDYNASNDTFSIDLKNDTLAVAFKKITDITGKNLVFSPDLATKRLSGYIKNKSFDSAIDKLAFSNNLLITKTKDNYYLFESSEEFMSSNQTNNSSRNSRNNRSSSNQSKKNKTKRRYTQSDFYFNVLDTINNRLEVSFENTPISTIIQDIGAALNTNIFTSDPLTNIGTITANITDINYDDLLEKILENTEFTFNKKNNIYFFGKKETATLRNSLLIPLMHRSIEKMNQTSTSGNNNFYSGGNSGFNSGNGFNNIISSNTQNNFNNSTTTNSQSLNSSNNQQRINTRNNRSFNNYQSNSEALVNILPKEIIQDLEIKTDVELNSFIVSGPAQNIEKFKRFITKIDKPIPVILIEVMILEVSKTNSLEAGVEFGLADEAINSTGQIFPEMGLTLGSNGINNIISSINKFGTFNIGKVNAGFYATIDAMETNGSLKIRSTPKLSTLNGHQATLTNGETSYYVVTTNNIIGTESPLTTETKNYVPIEANLSISIRPLISGDEQITMGINVSQSSFGERIDNEAPPSLSTKEFTSTIRVGDQDVILLGGLEKKSKEDFTSGVPFLARIPIIKWLFSKRTRIASKSKLSILIKPTIIR